MALFPLFTKVLCVLIIPKAKTIYNFAHVDVISQILVDVQEKQVVEPFLCQCGSSLSLKHTRRCLFFLFFSPLSKVGGQTVPLSPPFRHLWLQTDRVVGHQRETRGHFPLKI